MAKVTKQKQHFLNTRDQTMIFLEILPFDYISGHWGEESFQWTVLQCQLLCSLNTTTTLVNAWIMPS